MALLAHLSVRSTRRLSPSFVRLELAGPDLADLGVDGPTWDVRFKLLLPGPGGRLPVLDPQTWWTDFAALPEDERNHLRTYTIRAVRGAGVAAAIVVDVVLHPGAHGPGSTWAAHARVGDPVLAVLPRRGEDWGGTAWDPGDADRVVLVADESAVPAACSILEALPADARGSAWLEVPRPEDVQPVTAPAGVDVRWLPRDGAPVGTLAVAAVAAVVDPVGAVAGPPGRPPALVPEPAEEDGDLLWETPADLADLDLADLDGADAAEHAPGSGCEGATSDTYAWVAGESTMVRALRRHFVQQVGLPRDRVAFMGYWRKGVSMRG